MKRTNFLAHILLLALFLACMVMPVCADSGPKASAVVDIKGLEGRQCYVTLMSLNPYSTQYSSQVKERPDGTRYYEEEGWVPAWIERSFALYPKIWNKFRDYELTNPERLYFLSECGVASSEGRYIWNVYPPVVFKVLLYFSDTDSFVITEEFSECYAFDSYFTVDVTGVELIPGETVTMPAAVRSYDYTRELLGLAARAILTIALETVLAWWVFQLKTPKQLGLILLVNLVTQVGLNLGLNWEVYINGPGLFLIVPYVKMEFWVLIVESIVYGLWMPDIPKEDRLPRTLRYAIIANGLSFAAGWGLALVIPGMF